MAKAKQQIETQVDDAAIEAAIDPGALVSRYLATLTAEEALSSVSALLAQARFSLEKLGGARAIGAAIASHMGTPKRAKHSAVSVASFVESLLNEGDANLSRIQKAVTEHASMFCVIILKGEAFACHKSIRGALEYGVEPQTFGPDMLAKIPATVRTVRKEGTRGAPSTVLAIA